MAAYDALDGFRARIRCWAAEHVPQNWEQQYGEADDQEFLGFQRWWLRELRSGGYAAPHWAKQWGGGFSLAEQVVIFEELTRAGAPHLRSSFVALNHTYATLQAGGTQEQRQRHLPAILDGELWCQGFSEPEAGSDLAALRTRAVRDGDDYLVNGQKIWSSVAMHADWCLLLVRTNPDLPKRKGISYLLMDMRTPGIEVRAIKQATGAAEFCEIFLSDVRVPVANRVGAENDGWRIAQATLSAERGPTILELAERLTSAMGWLVGLAADTGLGRGRRAIDDPAIRERLAELDTQVTILKLLCRKVVDDLIATAGTGPEASIIKVYYSELLRGLMSFGTEIAGLATHRHVTKPLGAGSESGNWMLDYVDSWSWITGGGTNEIQRNVIGERVLGLPREPLPSR